jgi:hypothetical protein
MKKGKHTEEQIIGVMKADPRVYRNGFASESYARTAFIEFLLRATFLFVVNNATSD